MTKSKQLLYIILGVIFWFVAAMIVRIGGEAVFTQNNPLLALLFVIAFPVTWVFFEITKKLGGINNSELLRPIVIITATATCLDAIAMSAFHQLYSQSFEVAFFGSAMILWGVFIGLVGAYYLEQNN
jgi:hypothetical protein